MIEAYMELTQLFNSNNAMSHTAHAYHNPDKNTTNSSFRKMIMAHSQINAMNTFNSHSMQHRMCLLFGCMVLTFIISLEICMGTMCTCCSWYRHFCGIVIVSSSKTWYTLNWINSGNARTMNKKSIVNGQQSWMRNQTTKM